MQTSEQNNKYHLSSYNESLNINDSQRDIMQNCGIVHQSPKSSSSSSSDLDDYRQGKRRRSSSSSSDSIPYKKRHRDRIEKITIPGFDGPLITYSLFKELQENTKSEDIIEAAYKDYRLKYENKKHDLFFQEHHNDEWFKERYDPEIYHQYRNERNIQSKRLSESFNHFLQNGLIVNYQFNEDDVNSKTAKYCDYISNKDKDDFEERERPDKEKAKAIDITESPLYAFDSDKLTLFIHQLPRNISRWQLLDVLKKIPGLVSLSLSDPIKLQNYNRYCWLTFDNEDNLNLANDSLRDYQISSDYKINPIKSKSLTSKKIRITPMLYANRKEEDLQLSKHIIEMYDKDKQIEGNNIFKDSDNRDKNLQLDLQLFYLRRVHAFCYYCVEEYDDERNLSTKCENCHLRMGYLQYDRNYSPIINDHDDETNNQMLIEVKDFDTLLTKKLEEFILKGVSATIEKIDLNDNEDIIKMRNNYCKEKTTTISSAKFQCNLCDKMFCGPEYVTNHIKNKHLSSIKDNVDRKYSDNIKKNNYLNDLTKNYERIKIISTMEDYFSYLNGMKKYQSYDHKRSYGNNYNNNTGGGYYYNRDRNRYQRGGSSSGGHNTRYRDHKDYDDSTEKKTIIVSNTGRKLICYDDL